MLAQAKVSCSNVFGDVRFLRGLWRGIQKISWGPSQFVDCAARARSLAGMRWCWATLFHRIAIWRVFVTLDFTTFQRNPNDSGRSALLGGTRPSCPRPWENASEVWVDALRFPGARA